MEKKLEELQEFKEIEVKCFKRLIIMLSIFVETAKKRRNSANGTRNMISGYLACMETLKIISFDEKKNLENLLHDYQISKIEER